MKATISVVALLVLVARAAEYAVLIAGSNGYWNYRHQADVCHSYHVLLDHGFNPDNIILFSYDDVPTDAMNPFPGKLFNHPGNYSRDVNEGCVKDYTGDAVNVTNFLAVLTGNHGAIVGGSGRVLESGPNDNVFINFIDHGAPGLVALPSEYLYADQLNDTLTYMHEHQMYKQLVFYLEACESGSMFDGILSKELNVYVMTAANPTEPSWATYCYPNEAINGTDLYVCLGDLFSVKWMEDSDAANFTVETLLDQFNTVKKLTNESHVMAYGNLAIRKEKLSNFQGPNNHAAKPMDFEDFASVNSYDAKLNYLYSLFTADPSDSNTQNLIQEVTYVEMIQQTFWLINQYLDPTGAENLLSGVAPVTDFACLRSSIETFEEQCGQLQDYALQYIQVLVNACEAGHSLAQMDGAFNEACTTAAKTVAELPQSYWALDTYLFAA